MMKLVHCHSVQNMLTFSIFFLYENGHKSSRTNSSVSSYSSALIFSPELRGKNNVLVFKAQNIGVNLMFLKLLVFQKQ